MYSILYICSVFYPGLKGGRGFNVVELDPMSKTVVKSAEYDTYQVGKYDTLDSNPT